MTLPLLLVKHRNPGAIFAVQIPEGPSREAHERTEEILDGWVRGQIGRVARGSDRDGLIKAWIRGKEVFQGDWLVNVAYGHFLVLSPAEFEASWKERKP